jgi:hypothetical protein
MQNLTELQALQTLASVEAEQEFKQKQVPLTPAEERAAVLELRRLAYVELHKNSYSLLSE